MTLPDERYRAMRSAYDFMVRLLNPQLTPRVPKKVRQEALRVLRHYPAHYHIDKMEELESKTAKPSPV